MIIHRAYFYDELLTFDFSNFTNLTTIGKEAFFGNKLTEVIIPNSVINIDKAAFAFNNLSKVTLSEDLKIIGKGAFSKNKLLEIIIPNFVITISEYAFNEAFNNENESNKVTLSKNLETIDYRAFSNNNLKEIDFSKSTKLSFISGFDNNELSHNT